MPDGLATGRAGRPRARGALKVVKLNVDEAPELSDRYGVRGIPLLVLFRDGSEVARQVGAVPHSQLREWLRPHLAPADQDRVALPSHFFSVRVSTSAGLRSGAP